MQHPETGPPVIILLAALTPFGVILILFLIALLRCQDTDIPAVMQALAAVLRAITRNGDS